MVPTKSPLHESFAKAMNYYKSLRNLNNKEIADALNLPATTISAWNTGRHLPDMDRLQRLAKYLDAPLVQFFDFSLDNIPDKELAILHRQLDTDEALIHFLKTFSKLSDEDKQLLAVLANKISR